MRQQAHGEEVKIEIAVEGSEDEGQGKAGQVSSVQDRRWGERARGGLLHRDRLPLFALGDPAQIVEIVAAHRVEFVACAFVCRFFCFCPMWVWAAPLLHRREFTPPLQRQVAQDVLLWAPPRSSMRRGSSK